MKRFVLGAVCLVAAVPAQGHDLWLIPPATAKVGEPVTVRAVSGMEFPKGTTAPNPANFETRRVLANGSTSAATAAGTDGDAGLLSFSPAGPGVHAVAVTTKPKVLKLPAAEFNAYLVSDGMPHVYLARAKEKTLDRDAVERYSKSPKALVRIGDGGGATLPMGLPLEITPAEDPFVKKSGSTLKVRVTFHGKPLSDANLGWDRPGDGEPPTGTVRTDAAGEALIPLARPGIMTVRLTHMTQPKTAEYEWESFWTTLTWHAPE